MEDNTHTSKQAYVRQPHPSQTTYKPHETKRPQPTRLYETQVPCGPAYIICPRKAVSLTICACQCCTPTKPNTFSTDHAPPRNTTQGCAFETPHNSALVYIRIAQVGVSAQGCGNKKGSKRSIRISRSVRCPRTGRSLRTPVR